MERREDVFGQDCCMMESLEKYKRVEQRAEVDQRRLARVKKKQEKMAEKDRRGHQQQRSGSQGGVQGCW